MIPDAALPVLAEAIHTVGDEIGFNAAADAAFVARHLDANGWAIVPRPGRVSGPLADLHPALAELLPLMPLPLGYREIGVLLGASHSAVRVRAQRLFDWLGVSDRMGAVLRAVVLGYLDEDAVLAPYRVPADAKAAV